jgi:uncharacterized RDD family membrane protein YckC
VASAPSGGVGPGPAEATVLGLDNIPLELPIAGAGSRALSAFLDYLLVGVLIFAWGMACLATFSVRPAVGWWALAAFLVGMFVLEYGYFAGIEILRGGQTVGKWALDLRVVTREGARAGNAALLIRNAVRTIDLLVGVPLMAADPLARRLGDRLAGTLVIHTHAPAEEVVLRRTPQGWTTEEAALLESFLRRAGELEGWRAERMARQLLEVIRRDDPALYAAVDPHLDAVQALRQAVEAEG